MTVYKPAGNKNSLKLDPRLLFPWMLAQKPTVSENLQDTLLKKIESKDFAYILKTIDLYIENGKKFNPKQSDEERLAFAVKEMQRLIPGEQILSLYQELLKDETSEPPALKNPVETVEVLLNVVREAQVAQDKEAAAILRVLETFSAITKKEHFVPSFMRPENKLEENTQPKKKDSSTSFSSTSTTTSPASTPNRINEKNHSFVRKPVGNMLFGESVLKNRAYLKDSKLAGTLVLATN